MLAVVLTVEQPAGMGGSQSPESCVSFLPGEGCSGGRCVPGGDREQLAAAHPAVARVIVSAGATCAYGTGTLIAQTADRAWLLSCAHLFDGLSCRVQVLFPHRQVYTGRLAGIDRTWDLALVELPPVAVEPVRLAPEAPQAGQWLTACGYGPDGQFRCVRGQLRGYVATERTGRFETLSLSGAARQGDSGGPVFNEAGQLVGVIWGSDGRMIVATSCGRIREFLRRLLPWWEPKPGLEEHWPVPQPVPADGSPGAPGGSLAPGSDELRRQVASLAERLDRVEAELGLVPARGSAGKLSERLLRLEEAAAVLPALRQKVAEAEAALGSQNLRAVVRDVALGLLAEQAPSAVDRWLPRLLEALGWTGPPSLAVLLAARWLGRILARRADLARRKLRAQVAAAQPPPTPSGTTQT